MKTIEHFVDGKSFSGKSKRTGEVFNPATGEQESEVKLGLKCGLGAHPEHMRPPDAS